MKRIAIAFFACLPAFGVGSVGQSINPLGPAPTASGIPDTRVYLMSITWVGDSVTGTVPSTVINTSQFPNLSGYKLSSFEIQPGSPNPTGGYSITITDGAGVDVLQSLGTGLSATSSSFVGSVASPLLAVSPTFNLSGNSVASARGTVLLYFAPATLVAATPTPNVLTGSVRGTVTPSPAAGPTGNNNETFLFTIGNCLPTVEYGFIHSQNATDGLTGCIEAPVGGFAPVYNAVAGYATDNLNASANALYGQSRCKVTGSACWGADVAAQSTTGATGVALTGLEAEMYVKNTGDLVDGVKVGGDFPVQPTSATGFELLIPNFLAGTGQWTNGITIDSGSTTGVALNIGLTAASGNSLGSQKIQFNSKDAGGIVRQPSINSDLAGNIFMNVTSGGQSVVINGPASSVNVTAIVNPSGTPLAIPTVGNNVISDTATQSLTNKTFNVPLTSGTGLQLFNTTTTCTTGAAVGSTCTTANISLPVAEADTSYRVTCTGKGLTNVPVVIATTNASASQFTITAAALTAAAASFASYDCVAGHN